jgi:hypothetical protein
MDVRDRLRTPELTEPPRPERARAVFERGRRRRVRRRAAGAGGTLAVLILAVVLAWPQLGVLQGPIVDDVVDAPTPTEPTPDEPAPDDPAPEEPTRDPQPDEGADPGPAPGGTADADGADGTDGAEAGAPALDAEASTDDRVQAPEGAADLVVTEVRVGTHDGFDRVVIDVGGEGRAGWFTELGADAFEDGSGAVVDVAGGAVLTIFVNAVAFPPDLPDPDVKWDGVTVAAPPGARVLTEVVDSVTFEGQHQLFIGLTEPVPYRIVRLDDPQRIVIDLVHP